MIFGTGQLKGWTLSPGPREERERTGRGAFLQAMLYQQAGDEAGLWAWLSRDVGGQPMAFHLVDCLVELYNELADEADDRESFAGQLRAAGYFLSVGRVPGVGRVSAVDDLIERAQQVNGPGECVEADDYRLVWRWPDGEVLAFERHPRWQLWWRDVSKQVERELAEQPLEQPTRAHLAELERRYLERANDQPRALAGPSEDGQPEGTHPDGGDGATERSPAPCPKAGPADDAPLAKVLRPFASDGGGGVAEADWQAHLSGDPELDQIQAEFDQALDAIADQQGEPPGEVEDPDEAFVLAVLAEVKARTWPSTNEGLRQALIAAGVEELAGKPVLRSKETSWLRCALQKAWEDEVARSMGAGPCEKHGDQVHLVCPRCRGIWPDEPAEEKETPSVIEAGVASVHHTLALVQRDAGDRSIWRQLAESSPTPTPPGATCAVGCTKPLGDYALAYQHGPGGYTSYAHRECVQAECVQAEIERERRRPRGDAIDGRRRALALGALKPYKARHKGEEDPACELCCKAIRRGDMCRRKSKTSSKRMHDACVRAELDQLEESDG